MLVEGDALKDKFDKISFEVKLEGSPDGGTISKMTSKYYTKGDFVLTEEDIKAGKEKALGMYKVVEAYLQENPDAYHLIEELNEKTYTYKYTLVEGDALKDKFEKISFEAQLEASSNGGTISKMKSKYYTKGDFMITEEDIKAGKEKVLGMYKVVEAYLLQNPEAYV
ncbi:hypothetical protein F0562_035454 [Nyssa sinensis]|uniref:Bet v I/Major latex protein domain-containing protein n=1 Tax=Nyssa sinensis TaxID=561372 RepID=A0A5J5AE14_9ASTE|nr:hypothetical protein F0562_035454 [Nyssa sinensis]